jgi:hypothetical protein
MLGSQLRGAHEYRSRLVDGLVDALVAQPHRRVVGELPLQVSADLLGAPPLGEKLRHQVAQLLIGVDATLEKPALAATERRTSSTRLSDLIEARADLVGRPYRG